MLAPMKTAVCIVTFPLSAAGYTPLSNLIKLLCGITNEVYIVSGGVALEKLKKERNVLSFEITHSDGNNAFERIINYANTQLKILRYIVSLSRKTDLFIFFIGGEGLFVPMLALKLLRKKVVLLLAGVGTKVLSINKAPLSKFMSFLVSANFYLANRLIVYSPRLIREANLSRHGIKIIIAHEHFVDFQKFVRKKRIDERLNIVGYVGRLSKEKGILCFTEAIPNILKMRNDVTFLIVGDGDLSTKIAEYLNKKNIKNKVKMMGWISHKDIPNHLNDLKLLISPSYTEGLPNIMLEAMACGTPVLATYVGAIPDVIEDGETGFLLKANDPKHIEERILELLDKPELLEKVSKSACERVRENFSEEKTLEIWRRILRELETL